jgi:hypothetical protein
MHYLVQDDGAEYQTIRTNTMQTQHCNRAIESS